MEEGNSEGNKSKLKTKQIQPEKSLQFNLIRLDEVKQKHVVERQQISEKREETKNFCEWVTRHHGVKNDVEEDPCYENRSLGWRGWEFDKVSNPIQILKKALLLETYPRGYELIRKNWMVRRRKDKSILANLSQEWFQIISGHDTITGSKLAVALLETCSDLVRFASEIRKVRVIVYHEIWRENCKMCNRLIVMIWNCLSMTPTLHIPFAFHVHILIYCCGPQVALILRETNVALK